MSTANSLFIYVIIFSQKYKDIRGRKGICLEWFIVDEFFQDSNEFSVLI